MSVGQNTTVDRSTIELQLQTACFSGPTSSASQPPFVGQLNVEVDAASGAIGIKAGLVTLTKAGIAVMTLALPVAGTQANGGDDGKVLRIISETANAHTVTTPTNGFNGALHIATFSGTLPNAFELVARNGSWWSVSTNLGVTLS